MQLITLTLLSLAALATASPRPLKYRADAARPYSSWMTDSYLSRGIPLGLNAKGEPYITYEHGVFGRALQLVYTATGDVKYYNAMKGAIDNIITPEGQLLDYNLTYYTLDDLRVGPQMLYLYQKTGEEKYRAAATEVIRQLDTNPRNSHGGLWHRSTYPNQMWLDGAYMVNPFYAMYTNMFEPKNNTKWDDIFNQLNLVHKGTWNTSTGLHHHGYDESFKAVWAKAANGGKSPEVWGRALGWYTMALIDVLDHFPKSHPGHELLCKLFVEAMRGVVAAVDKSSGGWWLVMSQPGRKGNYIESSGTAMFTYSLFKGMRTGLLGRGTNQAVAEKAYALLTSSKFTRDVGNGTLDWDGTVQVGSLGGKGDYDYYVGVPIRLNDLKGLAPFVFASVEYEKRNK